MSILIHQPTIEAKAAVVPIPSAVRIPITETSIPFNAAKRQMWPLHLEGYGYTEEEYFVSGEAKVYAWGEKAGDAMRVKVENTPYTYRILVRKPASARDFSGTALVEVFNYANLMDNPGAGWGAANEYMMARGDAWVGISIRDSIFRALRKFDSARYAPLSMANPIPADRRNEPAMAYGIPADPECENGLSYDVISQVGALIRSDQEGGPFFGYDVNCLLGTGATAGDMSTYAGLVHNYAKQPSGKPVYDGFSIFMTGAPANLNNEEQNILAPDPRGIIYPIVPTMRVLTMGDMLGKGYHPDWSVYQRRPDSDGPESPYRIYEIAGSCIGYRADKPVYPCKEDAEKVGARWMDPFPKMPEYAFPTQYFIRSALDNLKQWAKNGVIPPKAERLEMQGEYPDTDFVLDEHGNAKGGIRNPYVDVPVAAYCWDGTIAPFDLEKLKALYPTQASYISKVAKCCTKLCRERWLLPEDAMEIIASAEHFSANW